MCVEGGGETIITITNLSVSLQSATTTEGLGLQVD